MSHITYIKKNKNFWKNKKVLVTGHTGFKGSWLVIIMKFLGAKVYGLSLKPGLLDIPVLLEVPGTFGFTFLLNEPGLP